MNISATYRSVGQILHTRIRRIRWLSPDDLPHCQYKDRPYIACNLKLRKITFIMEWSNAGYDRLQLEIAGDAKTGHILLTFYGEKYLCKLTIANSPSLCLHNSLFRFTNCIILDRYGVRTVRWHVKLDLTQGRGGKFRNAVVNYAPIHAVRE